MKRRDLERHLKKHGAHLLREGGRHSYWGMDAERSTSVPRHREIAYPLARSICKQLGIGALRMLALGLSLPSAVQGDEVRSPSAGEVDAAFHLDGSSQLPHELLDASRGG